MIHVPPFIRTLTGGVSLAVDSRAEEIENLIVRQHCRTSGKKTRSAHETADHLRKFLWQRMAVLPYFKYFDRGAQTEGIKNP